VDLLGDPVRKLPDRVWRLPRQEDDEAAADEGIGRILALSDGVFAIALTLLILDIVLPATTSDDNLGKALLHIWPRYLAYALSFLVIARFWVIHHQTFRLIVRDNATLVWLNFLLLFFIAFLPFPTAVIGAHEGSPAAAVLYAIAVCLTGASSAAYLWYATGRANLIRPDVGRGQIRAMRARSMSGPVLFALSVPVAAVAPYIAAAIWISAFPLARMSFVWFFDEESDEPAGGPGSVVGGDL
jgi:uncharacterized membrane protein